MDTMRRNPATDIDSEPHTLRSDSCSHGIPICKPSHLNSLSLTSNPLQISQSPTRSFVTHECKSQCKMSGMQACSMNANLQNEKSHCGSVPLDTSECSHSTNQTEHASSTSSETKSMGKEMFFNGKSDNQVAEQEHKRQPPTEDTSPCLPDNPSAWLSHQPSGVPSYSDKSNHVGPSFSNIASSAQEFISPSTIPSSDMSSSVRFFSFVILHAPEDQDEAIRVCGILHDLKIGEGTTFCEGFETAGVSPLKCLEDAVENSAFIVLLLTTGFLSKWGEFQTNAVLMNSIRNQHKSGTVIPFIPKFKTLQGKIPLPLTSLIQLDEKSLLFKTQVRNTFKLDIIQKQQDSWKREQDVKAFAKSVEDAKALTKDLETQQRFAMDFQAVYSKFCNLMSILPQQMHLGEGSVIHINNASNIQIGNQNSMNVQQTTNVPQMPGESYQDFNNEFQS